MRSFYLPAGVKNPKAIYDKAGIPCHLWNKAHADFYGGKRCYNKNMILMPPIY